MPDEPKTGTPAPSEPDLTNYVPKADHDAALKKAQDDLASTKAELQKKDLELLSPEYLDFREQRTKAGQPSVATPSVADPTKPAASADPTVAALTQKVDQLSTQLTQSLNVISDLQANQELANTMSLYPDFNEYKDAITNLLKSSQTELTYEQAYLIAKQSSAQTGQTGAPNTNNPKAPNNEKPTGSVPAKTLEPKEIKTTEEANAATLASMREKWPDLGDTI